MQLGIHEIESLDFATTNNHLHVPLTPQCCNEVNRRWWSYTPWWKTIFIYNLLDDKHTSYCMTIISFCIKFSHENFAVGLQGGTSLMSLQASLATMNYSFKTLNKNLVSGLHLPIVPWHFCNIAQCLFDIAWWIWCYLISIIASSSLLDIFLTFFETLVTSWHFPIIPQSFPDVVKHSLMALLCAFQ